MNNWKLPAAILVVLAVLTGGGIYLYSLPDDGVEEGKVYKLAQTWKTAANAKGEVDTRTFAFADRNVAKGSILVPVKDAHGIELVKEVDTLPPSTVRKVRVKVPRLELEDEVYPAYEYIQWQFRFAKKEEQTHIPIVTPRK